MALLTALSPASLPGLVGRNVINKVGDPIGAVGALWSDHASGRVGFIGVKTGWFSGALHAVPAQDVQTDARGRIILPYTSGQVQEAPSFAADDRITDAGEAAIYRHYSVEKKSGVVPAEAASGETNLHAGPAVSDPASAEATDRTAGTGKGGDEDTTDPR